MLGTHLIKSWSETQTTSAKSSAKSELYGIVRTTCESLGFVTLPEDLGAHATARLHMDATAARGIVDRREIYRRSVTWMSTFFGSRNSLRGTRHC